MTLLRLTAAIGTILVLTLAHGHGAESDADLPPPLGGEQAAKLSAGTYFALMQGRGLVAQSVGPDAGIFPVLRAGLEPLLDPMLGGNVALGGDPPALPANLRAQAEPHLTRSYTDPNLLVATFQEGRFSNGGAVDCGYAISVDSGLHWQRGLIPHLIASLDGGPFDRASDPVAGADSHGSIYLNVIGLTGSSSLWSTIVLSKSGDGGRTFDPPLTVLTNRNPSIFLDKNWMAINTFPGTATADRIVVTYTRFDSTINANPIDLLYSNDGGRSWTKPKTISPPDCQGSQPVFLPDGTLAVVYANHPGAASPSMEIVVSPDGGATFGAPHVVAQSPAHRDPVARSGTFLPTATADRQLGVLYVAYQANVGGPKVMFTRSRDRGLTWTSPKPVNDTPDGKSVFNPAIAVSPDGQHVTISFYDKRQDTADSGNIIDLYLAESFDGGDTWEPNLRVSEVSSDLSLAPLTPAGRMVGDYQGIVPALNFKTPGFAVWVDTRTGSPDPFVSSIRRHQGSRFNTWRQLAFSPAELANPEVSGEAADPEHDGLPNLIEYGRGTDPHRGDPPALGIIAKTANGLAKMEASFEFSTVADDLLWGWIATEDLGTWLPAPPNESSFSPGSTADRTRQVSSFATAPQNARFFRAAVRGR